MFRFIIRYFMVFVAVTTASASLHGVMVSRSNISQRIAQEAQSHVSARGYTVPERIKPEYLSKIADATDNLLCIIDADGRSYADLNEVKVFAQSAMDEFIATTLKTLVLRHQLTEVVRESIEEAAYNEGINTSTIPASMRTEYNSRVDKVIDNLKRTMSNDGRDYVRKHEVETAVRQEMKALFARIKHEQQSQNSSSWSSNTSSSSSSSSNFWSSLFGSSSNSPASAAAQSAPSLSSNNVYGFQLENKIPDIADSILREKGHSQDSLPARLIADYADAIQAVIKHARRYMADWRTDHMKLSELKEVTRHNLTRIFDRLAYRNESCTICLEDYESGDRLGHLQCGHYFHTDCIKTWFSKQHTCPLCRATTWSIQHTETIQ